MKMKKVIFIFKPHLQFFPHLDKRAGKGYPGSGEPVIERDYRPAISHRGGVQPEQG